MPHNIWFRKCYMVTCLQKTFNHCFYSKTDQMHNISNLFYFGTTIHMFQTVSPPIIRSLRLYIQCQVYVVQVLWLLASKQPQNREPDRLSKTCKVLLQSKINLRCCASGWFCYRNILRCTFLQT